MFFFFPGYLGINPILIGAAIIPAIILLIFVYKQDKLDKEPRPFLIKLIIFGIISTALAGFAERIGSYILSIFVSEDSNLYNIIMYFGIVAFAEEGFKYAVLKTATWKSPYFNCQFDGVVFAVFVSLGFALWENISYVLSYGFQTALLRAITAVPGHACFGVFMGAWYGLARRYYNYGYPGKSKAYRRMAVLLPALMHGAYDYIATQDSTLYSLIFVAFIIIMFLICFILVKRLSKNDRYI